MRFERQVGIKYLVASLVDVFRNSLTCVKKLSIKYSIPICHPMPAMAADVSRGITHCQLMLAKGIDKYKIRQPSAIYGDISIVYSQWIIEYSMGKEASNTR